MAHMLDLDSYLRQEEATGGTVGAACGVVRAIAAAAVEIEALLAAGPLAGNLAAPVAGAAGDHFAGETQKALDARADAVFMQALAGTATAIVASEELGEPVMLNAGGAVAVAIDPLDGSSNIDTNAPVGTIFSVLPVPEGAPADASAFLQPGTQQLAAGFLIYGPQTALVLTLGAGTRIFTRDRATGAFLCPSGPARIALDAREYAINGSNARHWDEPVRRYVQDCQQGSDGPRGQDFNTRWLASLVGEAYRILIRGGVYLYPGDSRPGYRMGRLRLVYEGNPVAWLIEQAGGSATDGEQRILDIAPREVHQRVPLVFGAANEVARIASYHSHPAPRALPLFRSRTLFHTPGETAGGSGLPGAVALMARLGAF